MRYAEARALLDRLPRFEVKPGLARIERLLRAVGLPERTHPAIHVAGTNGKGSVVAMLDAVLRAAGHRVGTYTSPEVIDFRDRVTIGGRWLSEHEWAAGISRLAPAIAVAEDVPAQFEAITAFALDALSRAGVDVSIVEVGLGGRFDATNVVQPMLTILTNVSLDHTAILGETVEKIAWEKVGIAKRGVPLLTGPLSDTVAGIVGEECTRVGAEWIRAEFPDLRIEARGDQFTTYSLDVNDLPARIELSLRGDFQCDNLAVVLGAIRVLRDCGTDIPNDAVIEGLRSVYWPGRFEIVRRTPTVILDGAHNVAGAKALAAEVERFVPERSRRRLVLGLLADKDVASIVNALVPMFDEVAVVASGSPRAMPADELATHVRQYAPTVTCYDSIRSALQSRLPTAGADEAWVVAGSLTVVSEARFIVEALQ